VTIATRLKANGPRGRRFTFGAALVASMALLLGSATSASAFTWYSGDQFQVNDAPPNGVYVNLYTNPTGQLLIINNAPTSWTYGPVHGCGGDSNCTREQLRAGVEVSDPDGWLGSYAQDRMMEALDPSEQDDFAQAISDVQQSDNGEPRCLDLTIRYYGDYDYNWSWRPLSDGNCEEGVYFSP